MHLPADLEQGCAPHPAAIVKPKQPRTFDSIIEYANKNEDVRALTADRLDECSSKLSQALALLRQQQQEMSSK